MNFNKSVEQYITVCPLNSPHAFFSVCWTVYPLNSKSVEQNSHPYTKITKSLKVLFNSSEILRKNYLHRENMYWHEFNEQ